MSNEADIYNFEEIVPAAVAVVLSGFGLVAIWQGSPTEFQKARPRVEVVWQTGSVTQPIRLLQIPAGSQITRAQAWKGVLTIAAITDAADTSKGTHGAYVSRVRNVLAYLPSQINGQAAGLTRHKLQFEYESGTTRQYRNEQGYWQSNITFACDLSIQANAWSDFNETTTQPA